MVIKWVIASLPNSAKIDEIRCHAILCERNCPQKSPRCAFQANCEFNLSFAQHQPEFCVCTTHGTNEPGESCKQESSFLDETLLQTVSRAVRELCKSFHASYPECAKLRLVWRKTQVETARCVALTPKTCSSARPCLFWLFLSRFVYRPVVAVLSWSSSSWISLNGTPSSSRARAVVCLVTCDLLVPICLASICSTAWIESCSPRLSLLEKDTQTGRSFCWYQSGPSRC